MDEEESKRNFELGQKAMAGDEVAQKLYLGSYMLVMDGRGNLFRCKGDIPNGYFVPRMRTPVYDSDGFLLTQYWSLPRI